MKFDRILIILMLVFFASCSCDETQSCEGLSANGQRLLPQNLAGSIFKNANDSIINIYSRSSRIQGATNEDCSSSGWGSCDCLDCPSKDGRVHYALSPIFSTRSITTKITKGTIYRGVYYPNDTTIIDYLPRNEEFYVVNVDETSSSSNPAFQVDFLGFSYIFSVDRAGDGYTLVSNAQDPEVDLLATFSTPEKTYENILVLNNNASRFIEKSKFLNKLYFSESEGVVAFESRSEGLFYLIK